MGKSRVIDLDKGWDKILVELNDLNDADVYIGIHSDAQSSDETGELTAAAIGAIQEFGTETIPQRSWLRAGIDHYSREIGDKYSQIFKDVTKGRGTSAKRGLNRLGLFGQAKIREYITKVGQTVWTDISDETKDRKGSTKILIDSGQLRGGVTYTIRPAEVGASTSESVAAGMKRPESSTSKPSRKTRRDTRQSKEQRRPRDRSRAKKKRGRRAKGKS